MGSGNGAEFFEVWLSLVERYVRDVEAAGSNPVTSTSKKPAWDLNFQDSRRAFFIP